MNTESRALFEELQELLRNRRIAAGIALRDERRDDIAAICPGCAEAGHALRALAQWLDVGYEDRGLLAELLQRFRKNQRRQLPLADYVYLRLAEAVLAMRREELTAALNHF